MLDRTVAIAEGSRAKDNACDGYTGPDHSTYEGACALLARIRKVRYFAGAPCNLIVAHVDNFNGKPVYGLREIGTKWDVSPRRGAHAARALSISNATLKAFPGITIDLILGGGKTTPISRARQACIRACWDAGFAPTFVVLAQFFAVNESSIRRALEATDPKRIAA